MAKILRGKNKGQIIEMHQFCNDWITGSDGKVYNPTSLEFTDEEKKRIIAAFYNGSCGIMFGLYHFKGNRLVRRKR
jgi:hypothetical protein